MSEQNSTAYIYALSDSRKPDRIRYIGKSERNVIARLKQHVRDKFANYAKSKWIERISHDGATVRLIIIEECAKAEASGREKYWISHFRTEGADLLNLTDGGDGFSGGSHTLLTRQKMSAAKIGKSHSGISIEKMRASKMGAKIGPMDDAHKMAISKALSGRPAHNKGVKPSEATKVKISQAMKGMPGNTAGRKFGPRSEDVKRKISEGQAKRWAAKIRNAA